MKTSIGAKSVPKFNLIVGADAMSAQGHYQATHEDSIHNSLETDCTKRVQSWF